MWLSVPQSLRILESHFCNKGRSDVRFWPDSFLGRVEENEAPPKGNGVKGVGICSILLPFFGLAESPLQKQNAVPALPKNWNMALLRGAGARSSCSIRPGPLGPRAKNHNKVVNDSQCNSETLQL